MAKRSKYTYDVASARYRDRVTGRYISRRTVRSAVDDAIVSSEARVAGYATMLRESTIGLAEWEALMRQEIKSSQLWARSAAVGGWESMTAAEYGEVGARIKKQYAYLSNFVDDLLSGKQALDGTLGRRARMYIGQARATYHHGLSLIMEDLGMTEERNVLGDAHHCDVCAEQTALGWVPLGALVPVGERSCLSNCQCDMEYR